jgi:hypothetical protein
MHPSKQETQKENTMSNPNEKNELIDQALQESVSGGLARDIPLCSVSCSIFSIDVCHVDLCKIRLPI